MTGKHIYVLPDGYAVIPETGKPAVQAELPSNVVKKIAEDIAQEVAAHIEVMYPDAVIATSKNMLVSVRGCVYNEIMASLNLHDADAIMKRLDERKRFRRAYRAIYQKIRKVK